VVRTARAAAAAVEARFVPVRRSTSAAPHQVYFPLKSLFAERSVVWFQGWRSSTGPERILLDESPPRPVVIERRSQQDADAQIDLDESW